MLAVGRNIVVGSEIGSHVHRCFFIDVFQRFALLIVGIHMEGEGHLWLVFDLIPRCHEVVGSGFHVVIDSLTRKVAAYLDVLDILICIGHGIRQIDVGSLGIVRDVEIDVVGDGARFFDRIRGCADTTSKDKAKDSDTKQKFAHGSCLLFKKTFSHQQRC